MAAELIAAGVDVHEIYRRLYEGVPVRQARRCSAAALANVERYDDGALTITRLRRGLRESGAEESYSEGIIDHLRARRGHRGRRARPRADRLRAARRHGRSRCARPTARIDVSAIARAGGGGGHRQAAGFTTAARPRTSSSPSCASRSPSSSRPAGASRMRDASGLLLVDKPAGKTSHDVVAACGASCRGGGSATPGRSTRSRPACCSSLVGRATRAQRFLMALPKTYEVVARLGRDVDTGDPEGEIASPAAFRPTRSTLPTGESCSARRPTARSRSAAGAPTRGRARGEDGRDPRAHRHRGPLRAALARR